MGLSVYKVCTKDLESFYRNTLIFVSRFLVQNFLLNYVRIIKSDQNDVMVNYLCFACQKCYLLLFFLYKKAKQT